MKIYFRIFLFLVLIEPSFCLEKNTYSISVCTTSSKEAANRCKENISKTSNLEAFIQKNPNKSYSTYFGNFNSYNEAKSILNSSSDFIKKQKPFIKKIENSEEEEKDDTQKNIQQEVQILNENTNKDIDEKIKEVDKEIKKIDENIILIKKRKALDEEEQRKKAELEVQEEQELAEKNRKEKGEEIRKKAEFENQKIKEERDKALIESQKIQREKIFAEDERKKIELENQRIKDEKDKALIEIQKIKEEAKIKALSDEKRVKEEQEIAEKNRKEKEEEIRKKAELENQKIKEERDKALIESQKIKDVKDKALLEFQEIERKKTLADEEIKKLNEKIIHIKKEKDKFLLEFQEIERKRILTNELNNLNNLDNFENLLIKVDSAKNIMFLKGKNNNGEIIDIKTYKVSTAKTTIKKPLGVGSITAISLNPEWNPTTKTLKAFKEKGINLPAVVPYGDKLNYMGAAKINLSHKVDGQEVYRIHGTLNENTIGTNESSGCIRMKNKEVVELATLLEKYSKTKSFNNISVVLE